MGQFNPLEYRQAIAGVITGLVLAFFGVDGYRGIVNPRPDPFTGTDGKALERRIDALEGHWENLNWRMLQVEDCCDECEDDAHEHQRNHK